MPRTCKKGRSSETTTSRASMQQRTCILGSLLRLPLGCRMSSTWPLCNRHTPQSPATGQCREETRGALSPSSWPKASLCLLRVTPIASLPDSGVRVVFCCFYLIAVPINRAAGILALGLCLPPHRLIRRFASSEATNTFTYALQQQAPNPHLAFSLIILS